jgi:Protein of unknown function (DUF4087)
LKQRISIKQVTLDRLVRSAALTLALAIGSAAVPGHASAPQAAASSSGGVAETRCGWFDNPTPQNASLVDRDGAWTISVQGGHSAAGRWPRFKASQASHWVRTNAGSYGYGCACMRVTVDREASTIKRIVSSTPKALAVCRNDASIRDSEPFNPLK